MKKLARVADKMWLYASYVAGVSLVGIMLLIVVNVIARRFFNLPIYGSTELVQYGALIGGALALSQNEWFDGNIQMTLILEKVSDKTRVIFEIIDYVICSVAFIFVSYLLVQQTVHRFEINDLTVDLKMPVGIFAGILTAGFIYLTICLFIKTILKFNQLKTGVNLCGKYATMD